MRRRRAKNNLLYKTMYPTSPIVIASLRRRGIGVDIRLLLVIITSIFGLLCLIPNLIRTQRSLANIPTATRLPAGPVALLLSYSNRRIIINPTKKVPDGITVHEVYYDHSEPVKIEDIIVKVETSNKIDKPLHREQFPSRAISSDQHEKTPILASRKRTWNKN